MKNRNLLHCARAAACIVVLLLCGCAAIYVRKPDVSDRPKDPYPGIKYDARILYTVFGNEYAVIALIKACAIADMVPSGAVDT